MCIDGHVYRFLNSAVRNSGVMKSDLQRSCWHVNVELYIYIEVVKLDHMGVIFLKF